MIQVWIFVTTEKLIVSEPMIYQIKKIGAHYYEEYKLIEKALP